MPRQLTIDTHDHGPPATDNGVRRDRGNLTGVARQAEPEGMPTSAQYWRAEAQRLIAQREAEASAAARPAGTGGIV